MGVVINCMGKGKEGSQTYNLYIEVYTQLERVKIQWSAQVRFTSLRSWTAEKSTSEITISLSLTYALMAKWQWKRITVEKACEWNSLLASNCQPGVWDFEGQEQERRVLKECTAAGSYWVRDVAAVCLIWLFAAHGADFFLYLLWNTQAVPMLTIVVYLCLLHMGINCI